MTALGILYPGHFAEDDYPRIEQLLGSDIRVDLIGTENEEDAGGTETVPGAPDGSAPDHDAWLRRSVEALRLSGAEAVVWANTRGGFDQGWEGAHAQVRELALAAGMPASSTSFGFVNAAREIGVRRVAVAAPYADDVTARFTEFLRAGGLDAVAAHSAGQATAAEVAGWGEAQVRALARAADTADAQALLVPCTALHTASCVAELEKELGKPVLTANQVTVWEALRLTDRRVNAPGLGALFTREPVIQV
ncbi:maleate cis-trans isomerase family protein [Streptomyces sennicomposti]|uniref:maleate cis-trans isomerase family protein n=1 Tax=Streptomyces sennicomposti TaxID=2873384 RepID=UPI001CA7B00D|nr:decarboxylase [Streptomyces sennicomposti]MBY8867215.1 decarboxylase [Streptomyces sennicomposti]